MNVHADKTHEINVRSVANGVSSTQSGGEYALRISDNRAQAIAQRKLQEKAADSLRRKQSMAFHELNGNGLHFGPGARLLMPVDQESTALTPSTGGRVAALASVVARGLRSTLQLKRYEPSERIEFTYNDQRFSGVVVRIKTDSENDNEIIYGVDSNMDGDQQSLLVKNEQVVSIESPPTENIDPGSIKQIMGMPVVTLDKKFVEANAAARKKGGGVLGAAEGDFMVGHGILIKKKNVQVREAPTREDLSKQNFQTNVLVDLATMATTKSGQMLLGSIEAAARASGKVVLIDWVDGQISRSNAGQLGDGGSWDATNNLPGKPADSNVGYNPDLLGLPMNRGLGDSMMETQDEIVWPALEDEFGRPREKPSDVTLFHELVHADDVLHGRLYTQEVPSGDFDRSKVSEMHAVGLEEYYDEDFISGKTDAPSIYSENTYRHERGVALRGWYKDQREIEKYESELTGKEKEQKLLQLPKDLKYKGLRKQKTIRDHELKVAKVELENQRRSARNEAIRRARARNALDTEEIRESRQVLLENIKASNADVRPESTRKSGKSSTKSTGSGKFSSKAKKSADKKSRKPSSASSPARGKPKKKSAQPYPDFGLAEGRGKIFSVSEISQQYELFRQALSGGGDDVEALHDSIQRFTAHLDWQVAEMQPDPGLRNDFVDHSNFHLPRDPTSNSFQTMIVSQGEDNVRAYWVFVWFTKFADLL